MEKVHCKACKHITDADSDDPKCGVSVVKDWDCVEGLVELQRSCRAKNRAGDCRKFEPAKKPKKAKAKPAKKAPAKKTPAKKKKKSFLGLFFWGTPVLVLLLAVGCRNVESTTKVIAYPGATVIIDTKQEQLAPKDYGGLGVSPELDISPL